MPKYRVTGGADGTAGVDIGGERFEPGDAVEAAAKDVKWLVDDGYLSATGNARPAPVDEEE